MLEQEVKTRSKKAKAPYTFLYSVLSVKYHCNINILVVLIKLTLRMKRDYGIRSHDRSGFGRGGFKTTKGVGKHDILSQNHYLVKLNPKCHMNYS